MNENLITVLGQNTFKWIITGVAGFIGSNILEILLKHNQEVIGIDNFETGHKKIFLMYKINSLRKIG